MDDQQTQTADTQTTGAGVPTQTSPQVTMQYALPRGTELLRFAVNYYRSHVAILLSITAIPFLFAVASLFAGKLGLKPLADIFSAVSAVVGWFASLAVLVVLTSEGATAQGAYRRASTMLLAALWVMLLSGLATIGGFALLVVPGIIISLYLTFGVYILFAEDLRGMAALTRSWHYADGLLGQIFWRSLFLGFVLILAYIAVGILVSIFDSIEGIPSDSAEVSVVGGSLQTLFHTMVAGPLSSIYAFAMYRSVRDAKQAQPATPELSLKAQRRIKIFAMLGVVFLISLMALGLAFMGMSWKEGLLPMPSSTAPASSASALLGVMGSFVQ